MNYTEDYNANEEFYTKVRPQFAAGQDVGRDTWCATDWMVARLIRQSYLQKLDKANIPNVANLQSSLRDVEYDPGRQYSLPWQSGFTGIGYNPKATNGKKIEYGVESGDPVPTCSSTRSRWCVPRKSGPSLRRSGCASMATRACPRWKRGSFARCRLPLAGAGAGHLRAPEPPRHLRPDDPLVQAAIGKRSPEEVAREAVEGTHLDDPRVREALWKGGAAAVAASTDPMIALARRLDPQARAIRKDFESRVDGALARNGELLFQAAVAVRGTSSYPDATLTLRLSYGTIAGWTVSGRQIRAITLLSGLYDRNTGQFPFAVAPTWLAARSKLDPAMPFDLATTNDIIGGNSGSPLINRNGEVVALIFDGNRGSLGGDYGYDAATNRAVALHGQAILEGLERVYGAGRLVKEIRSHGPD